MSLQTRSATDVVSLGVAFAAAVATRDSLAMRLLFTDPVDFRAVTPGRFWEGDVAASVVDDIVLGAWFGPDTHVVELLPVETDRFADRCRVTYRLRVRRPDKPMAVEQTAYYTAAEGRIAWMRLVCSGFRPEGS